jgi:hypothetical protein
MEMNSLSKSEGGHLPAAQRRSREKEDSSPASVTTGNPVPGAFEIQSVLSVYFQGHRAESLTERAPKGRPTRATRNPGPSIPRSPGGLPTALRKH